MDGGGIAGAGGVLMRRVALALVMTLAGCGVHSLTDKVENGTNRYQRLHLSAAATNACLTSGGFVDNRGMFGTAMCVHHYADAGKVCSGKHDCTGQCINTAWQGGKWPKTGDRMSGTCQPDDQQFGCYTVVEGGLVADGGGCVD